MGTWVLNAEALVIDSPRISGQEIMCSSHEFFPNLVSAVDSLSGMKFNGSRCMS